MGSAISKAGLKPTDIAAIGLTVQRETCLLWDSSTGRPLGNAIVWQDRRTAPLCNQLRQAGKAEEIYDRTGLVLDAYFSATKLAWLLEQAKKEADPPLTLTRCWPVPSIAGCCGTSPGDRCTPPTTAMPAAPCCSTSPAAVG
jgi:glycerol kinase